MECGSPPFFILYRLILLSSTWTCGPPEWGSFRPRGIKWVRGKLLEIPNHSRYPTFLKQISGKSLYFTKNIICFQEK